MTANCMNISDKNHNSENGVEKNKVGKNGVAHFYPWEQNRDSIMITDSIQSQAFNFDFSRFKA